MLHPKVTGVGLQASAYHLPMILALARLFRKRLGVPAYVYVNSPEEKRGLERLNTDGQISGIVGNWSLNQALAEPVRDSGAIFEAGRRWENRIREPIARLIFEHRPLARGYFSGAQANPRMPLAERASAAQVVNAYVRSLEFWEREIREKNLSLIIEADKTAISVCRALNIQYRRVFLSKFDGEHFWACDEKLFNTRIHEIYQNLTEWPEVKLNITQPSQLYKVEKATAKFKLGWILRNLAVNLTKNVYLMLFGSHRGRHNVADLFTTAFTARNNYYRYARYVNTSLAELSGRQFVYFPLHKEPETNMLSASPDYFNQIAAITSLARDLPAGVPLVLKEHAPAFGLRGPGFYRDLRDIKNVCLIDALESSIDIIKQAAVTVTISGSAGLEASVLGRPTIQFGRNMINRFLPHVMTVRDERDIATFLRRALSGEIDTIRAREDGARFREALRQASFEMGEFMVENVDFSEQSAEAAFTALLDSLAVLPAVGPVAPNFYSQSV